MALRAQRTRGVCAKQLARLFSATDLFVCFGFDDFAAAIVASRADVVTQMRLTRRRLYGQCRIGQKIVRAVHSALGR